jgi:predicted DNA-binding transcriptional regulator YafY
VGRRSGTETAVAVLAAFIERRSWAQAALARRVGVSVRALRACLLSMEESGRFPLEREDVPPHVVWRLPASWLPEGVALSRKDAQTTVRLLSRLAAEPARDRLLETLLGPTALLHARGDVAEPEPAVLSAVEDACNGRLVLRVRYASTTSGPGSDASWRTLSVQQLLHGEHPRFVALERGKRGLRVFRVDRVVEARVVRDGFFQTCDGDELGAFIAASVDGFHGDGPVCRCVFFVRDPEARWVEGNLPVRGARIERVAGGIRVEVETAGVVVLARFVVGLGGAARAEDVLLRRVVERLAREALASQPSTSPARRRVGPRETRGGPDKPPPVREFEPCALERRKDT